MIRSERTQLIGRELSPSEPARRAAEAAWRIEWPRLVAGLTRMVGDIDAAEDLAQDALVAALEQWPRDGVPPNPGAWLMLTAKHRAIDRRRRDATFRRKLSVLGGELVIEDGEQPLPASLDPDLAIEDDLLRMVFTACHPVLGPPARVALTLRLVGGLTTAEIARAYLVPEPTVAQRIVRAKRRLTAERIPYEVPRGVELAGRLDSALEVIYLVFNEGYTATAGEDWVRVELVEEGLRLARVLAGLMPDEPEVHGLAALLELQSSRVWARSGRSGRSFGSRIRTAHGGTACSSAAASPSWDAPTRSTTGSADRLGATRYKRPSPPLMRWRRRPRRRTGAASPVSTRSSRNDSRPRSWSSTARLPSRWSTVPPRDSTSLTRSRDRSVERIPPAPRGARRLPCPPRARPGGSRLVPPGGRPDRERRGAAVPPRPRHESRRPATSEMSQA